MKELIENTGPLDRLFVCVGGGGFPNGHVCHFHTLLFACSDYEGELHSDDPETTDLSWFDPEALPPMLPNMKRTVEAYRRYKETFSFQLL